MDLMFKATLGAAVVVILAMLAKTKKTITSQAWCRCFRPLR